VEKTTVGYAARDLGISRQLVHVYIKKGLIRADKSGPEKTAAYVLWVEDIQKLLGSDKLVAAHAQRHRLLGKPKKKKATQDMAQGAEGPQEAAQGPQGTAEEPLAEAAGGLTGAATDLEPLA
jgi:hypothetical protein